MVFEERSWRKDLFLTHCSQIARTCDFSVVHHVLVILDLHRTLWHFIQNPLTDSFRSKHEVRRTVLHSSWGRTGLTVPNQWVSHDLSTDFFWRGWHNIPESSKDLGHEFPNLDPWIPKRSWMNFRGPHNSSEIVILCVQKCIAPMRKSLVSTRFSLVPDLNKVMKC